MLFRERKGYVSSFAKRDTDFLCLSQHSLLTRIAAGGFRYRKRRAPSPVLCRSPWRGSIGIQEEGTRLVHRCTSARPRNHVVPILNTAKYFGRTPCLRKRKNQLMRSGGGLGIRRFSPPHEAEGIPLLRCQFQTYVIRACARTPLL